MSRSLLQLKFIGERTYLVFALFVSSLLLWTHLYIPFNVDNDLYQCTGFQIARFGRFPYLGSWAHTFPGMAYIHAMGILLFGNTALGFRIIDVLFHLATVWLLFLLLKRWFPAIISALAGILFILYYVSEGYWLAGQPDGFAVFFIVASTYLYVEGANGAKSMLWNVAAGFAMGYAILIRPTYGLFMIFLPLFAGARSRPIVWWYLAGVALPFLIFIGPYLLIPNGPDQVYEAVFGFNLQTYGGIRDHYNMMNLVRHPLTILSFLSLLSPRRLDFRVPKYVKYLCIGYLFSALLSIYLMGKYFVYHFDPLFCILSVLAAYGIVKAVSFVPFRAVQFLLIGIFLLWAFRRFYPFDHLRYVRESWSQTKMNSLEYVYHKFKSDTEVGIPVEEAMCNFLSRPGNTNGAIEFCSLNPAVRWESGRREATRFTMVHALGLHAPGTKLSEFQMQCRREFLDSLRSVKPHFIILATVPANLELFDYQSPEQIVRGIPGVDSLLAVDYKYDTLIGAFEIYRHRPESYNNK